MTKNVRIENADTAPYEIAVDVVVETKFLRNPTDLARSETHGS